MCFTGERTERLENVVVACKHELRPNSHMLPSRTEPNIRPNSSEFGRTSASAELRPISNTHISPATNRASLRPEKHVLEIELKVCVYSRHGIGRCFNLAPAAQTV